MIFGFYTLGCKVNQYETQAMERLLQDLGHSIAPFDTPCDGYILNTCSVTAVADRKCRTVLRRCRRENPNAILAVCGCYSQHDPQAAAALGADVVGGSGQRQEFIAAVLQAARQRQPQVRVDEALRRREFEVLPPGGLEGRTRAMLKVQDGCANFCTYCIIPYTRGPVRSAPLDLALDQARDLAAQGYRELVVTGIEIASWGRDLPGKPQPHTLFGAICQAVPDLRVRLGSLEPRIVTEEFCQALCRYPNLCPQFHLSLQSGSDGVLGRMKRKYTTARFLESVRLLRQYFPGCALTTDLIVGFPGETEAEFAETLAFLEQCAFADMHIFPYSRRPGTPADKMPGQLPNAIKEDRSRRAIALANEMNLRYRQALVGRPCQVLFEEAQGELFVGHTPNYVKIYCPGQGLHNALRTVVPEGIYRDGLLAKSGET